MPEVIAASVAPSSPAPAQSEAPKPAAAAPAASVENKAPSIFEEFGEVLKKHGGLEYKANGKTHKATDVQAIVRNLSRAHGTEEKVAELTKSHAELMQERQKREAIKAEKDPRKRWKLMADFLGDGGVLSEAAEAQFLTQAEEHEKLEQMTPREREMARELSELRRIKEEAAEKEARAAQEAEEKAYLEETSKVGDYVAGRLTAALKAANVPANDAHELVPRAFDLMQKAREGGYEVSDDEIASALVEERESKSWGHVLKLDDVKVVEKFKSAGRLKSLAQAVAAAIKSGNGTATAALEGNPPPPKQVAPDDFAAPKPQIKRSW